MNTTKLVSAVVSVAILGSSIAVFRASAPAVYAADTPNVTWLEGRPVTTLAPVVVYATPSAQARVAPLEDTASQVDSGISVLDIDKLNLGPQLHMPYYSFGTHARTLVKE